MTIEDFKKKSKHMPDAPGVYFFLDKRKKVLYIGKAASLRDRVRSYFAHDIAEVRSPLIAKIVTEAQSLDWRKTDSVLEALILEANLIKQYKPRGNTDLKDDKSWNYLVIVKETYPRVLLVRGKNLNADFIPAKRGYSTQGSFAYRSKNISVPRHMHTKLRQTLL
jgi:excinuclease ABC subunit C